MFESVFVRAAHAHHSLTHSFSDARSRRNNKTERTERIYATVVAMVVVVWYEVLYFAAQFIAFDEARRGNEATKKTNGVCLCAVHIRSDVGQKENKTRKMSESRMQGNRPMHWQSTRDHKRQCGLSVYRRHALVR